MPERVVIGTAKVADEGGADQGVADLETYHEGKVVAKVHCMTKRFKRGTGVATGSSAYYDDCDMALQGPIDSLEVVVALSEPKNSVQLENLNVEIATK